MTPEQKKAVPRHLRGAGKRRYWCPHCSTYHGYPPSLCKNNPNYEKNRKARSEAASRTAKRQHAEEGLEEKRMAGFRRWLEVPGNRQKMLEHVSRIGKLTRNDGIHNPFYGRKHSLETRLKMSRSQTVAQNRLREEDLDRVVVAPVVPSDSSFDFFRRPTSEPVDEFSTSDLLAAWERGDFGP